MAAPLETLAAAPPEVARLRVLYDTMVRIRRFELRVAALVESGEVGCPCHLYVGQEAVAAGVCAALEPADTVWGNHRSHGHYLAKGGDLNAMMAEIFVKRTGCSGGRGGSMHLFAPEAGVLGTVPIVAATVPLAVGAALAAKLSNRRDVAVAFFGDGALDEGHIQESLNLAALERLPVLFVCENNLYASHLHLSERRANPNLAAAAEVLMPAVVEDGNDVLRVYAAARAAAARARSGRGPSFLEFRTFRWLGHVGASWDMDVGVKRRGELREWLPRDPLARAARALEELGEGRAAIEAIDDAAAREVEEAVRFARESPPPAAEETLAHVFAAGREGR